MQFKLHYYYVYCTRIKLDYKSYGHEVMFPFNIHHKEIYRTLLIKIISIPLQPKIYGMLTSILHFCAVAKKLVIPNKKIKEPDIERLISMLWLVCLRWVQIKQYSGSFACGRPDPPKSEAKERTSIVLTGFLSN